MSWKLATGSCPDAVPRLSGHLPDQLFVMRKCRWLCWSCAALTSAPELGRMNYLLGLLLFGAGGVLLRRWVRIVRRNSAVLNGRCPPRGGCPSGLRGAASLALLLALALMGWSAAEVRAQADPALYPAQNTSDRTWPQAFDATIAPLAFQ